MPGLDGDVERGGRLVGHQQPRLGGQRDRDRDALPHAAGELPRVGAQRLLRVGDAHRVQQLAPPGSRASDLDTPRW